jgi:hypothetical protein
MGMPVVFIVSPEWDLRGAVRAELREAGIAAMGIETVDDMARTIAGGLLPTWSFWVASICITRQHAKPCKTWPPVCRFS